MFINNLLIIAKKFKFIRILIYSIKNKYKIFQKFNLNKNSLIIDIGANQGEVSQYFLDQFSCKIEAYEPNPHAFEKLSNRFRYNNNVKCYNKGVSTNHSNRKLYHHKDYDINNLVYSHASSFLNNKENVDVNNYTLVETISINYLLDKHKFIDLIKIDIEGYEYKILPDLIKNKNKIKYVLCELHGNPKNLSLKGNMKNSFLENEYFTLQKTLNNEKLLNSWFYEYY